MHFLIGIGLLGVLIAYAFGEVAARIFIGAVLGLGALIVCVIFGISLHVVFTQ